MPEDGRMNLAAVVPPPDQGAGRHDRPSLVGFLTDRDDRGSAARGPAEATSETLDLRRGGIRAAISAMQKSATPRVLIVDISGEEQPLSALANCPMSSNPMSACWSWARSSTPTSTARSPAAWVPRNISASRSPAKKCSAILARSRRAAPSPHPPCWAAARSRSPACAAASARPRSRSTWPGISASTCIAIRCCWIPTRISAPPRSC